MFQGFLPIRRESRRYDPRQKPGRHPVTHNLARLFIQDLSILDAAYFDPFFGPLGASWLVDAELTGYRDEKGMLYDFRPCKQTIKKIVDEQFDHTLILPESLRQGRQLEYECPEQALSFVPGNTFTPAGLEIALKTAIEAQFRADGRENILAVDVRLREVPFPTGKPWYRYTHGLKFHDGNCQRLWHGHRNAIDIRVNEQQDLELERTIADLFFNAHIANQENILGKGRWKIGQRQTHVDWVEIGYEASQGFFRTRIPGQNVVVLPMECTVENIAGFVLEETARRRTGSLEVVVYEGIHKGSRLSQIAHR